MENLKIAGIMVGSIALMALAAFVLSKVFNTKNLVPLLATTTSTTTSAKSTSTTSTIISKILETKTATDTVGNYTFQYGNKYESRYLKVSDWPPSGQYLGQDYACLSAGTTTARTGKTEEKKIKDTNSCVTIVENQVGSSTVTQYAYVFAVASGTEVFTFSTEAASCDGLKLTQKLACETDQSLFDPDSVALQLFKSLRKINF
jgi:hypothetical protein